MKAVDTPDWLVAAVQRPELLDVLWGDPPLRAPRERVLRWSSPVWSAGGTPTPGVPARYRVARALRTRPGKWAQVVLRSRFDAIVLQVWLLRMGGYQITQRFEHGHTAVYARYVGR